MFVEEYIWHLLICLVFIIHKFYLKKNISVGNEELNMFKMRQELKC